MIDLQKIRSALQSPDEEIRRSALHSLKGVSSPGAQAVLFIAMGDESWRVRKEAVECYLCSRPDLNSIEQLLDLLRNGDNAGLRNSAAEAVVRLDSAPVSLLIKLAQDQDVDVRKFVIDAMGAIGDPIFAPSLLVALHDPEVNVAAAAAEQLGTLGDSGAAEHLMQAIQERDDILFRFSALEALGILAAPSPVPEKLAKLAEQDILKKAVFECLGTISDESSLNLLLDGFTCRQKNSRAAAVKALYKIYRRSPAAAQEKIGEALRLLRDSDIIDGLLELFDNRDGALTEALIWTSTMTMDARFIPLLVEDDNAAAAISALKCFGCEELREIVLKYSTLNESGRICLCVLIAECGYSSFYNVIEEALHDPSSQVRKAAAMAVGKLGLNACIPNLIALVDDNDEQVYKAAIASLKSLVTVSQPAVLAEAVHFCSSKLSHHRKAAAFLLPALGEPVRLRQLLQDEDPQVREAAVSAIGTHCVGPLCPMLIAALNDEDPDVRTAVADALGNLHDPAALDALGHALNDEDAWVQSAALKAITKIEPASALASIKKIYTKAEGLLLITIIKILESVGGPEAEEMVRHSLQNSDRDIVRQAEKSLERIIVTNSD